jgi:DNA (cytosine-5)-methyltransferase 1
VKIKYADLFCGLGGTRLGLEAALQSMGLTGQHVFSSEIKQYAVEAYENNFGDTPTGDITQVEAANIPDFDFLLAGFPCQAFSSAGKRLGFEDTRGTLFFDVARILKAKRPKGFLLENVEGLVSHENGKTLATMINVLTDIGYIADWKVFDSKDFGLAQSRKRVYIYGTLSRAVTLGAVKPRFCALSAVIEHSVPAKETEFIKKLLAHYAIEEVIGKKIKDKRGGADNIHSWSFALKGEVSAGQKELLGLLLKQRRNKKWAQLYGIDWMDGMPLTLEMISTFYKDSRLKDMLDDLVTKGYLAYEHPKKKLGGKRVYDTDKPKGYNIVTGKLSFEYSKILDPADIAPTLVATDVMRLGVPVGKGIRSLTVREGLRLFGFPESYKLDFLKTKDAFDLLGNTVSIPVVTHVSSYVLKALLTKERAPNVAITRTAI